MSEKHHIKRVVIKPDPGNKFLTERLGPDFAGVDIELEPGPNLIVGPNGSGKSTVFRCIRALLERDDDKRGSWAGFEITGFGKGDPRVDVEIHWSDGVVTTELDRKAQKRAVFLDGVKDNLAMAPHIASDIGLQLRSMWSSHGQGLIEQVANAIMQAVERDSVLLLDEPDGSLDMREMSRLSQLDKLYRKAGIQTIVISHHPLFLLRALQSRLDESGTTGTTGTTKWGLFESRLGSAFETSRIMGWSEAIQRKAVVTDQLFNVRGKGE